MDSKITSAPSPSGEAHTVKVLRQALEDLLRACPKSTDPEVLSARHQAQLVLDRLDPSYEVPENGSLFIA